MPAQEIQTLEEQELAKLKQQHSALFALIASGNDPIFVADQLGYTQEAVELLLKQVNGRAPVVKVENVGKLVADGQIEAIKCLINVIRNGESDIAKVSAARTMIGLGESIVDGEATGKLQQMIKEMKERLNEKSANVIPLVKSDAEQNVDPVEVKTKQMKKGFGRG